ncbi:MAG: CZB domain-containing protein, partial [Planctomycetota bacterium]|nr:CZB domain-containing protein [Planctomycetota bacterium]
MFKQMKLASKLYLGFGIVVVIAAVLGYMGYSSLGKIEHTVIIADEANRFIKIVNDARLAEKNFMMRGDEKYAKAMLDQKELIDTLVEEITARMKVAADKQLVAELHAEAGTYIDNARQYVDLQGKIDKLTAVSGPIVQSARNTQKLADDMSLDQEKKLAAVMNVQANIADGSRAHLSWAGEVKDFLADKNATLDVQTDGHKCGFGQWLESSDFAEHAVYCGQEFRTLIAGAKEKHLELHKSAIDIAEARNGTTDTSLEVYQQKTAPVLEFILGEFAKAEEILKTKVAERLANGDDAKQIKELLLAARQQEKNYFLRNTDEYVKKTNEQADNTIALAKDLKTRFNQQVNKDQVQDAIDACLTYKKAFADVVKYKGEQKVCETSMVAAARKLTEEATTLRVAKKAEMES